jgi:YD repeat-containing protein
VNPKIYSVSETEYDAVGRAYRISNPHNNPDPEYESEYWSERHFDALGRLIKEIPPDGTGSSNCATYEYLANSVTITDPAGYQRKYEYDALGRMVTVSEPDPNQTLPNLALETTATFTALDELLAITQGVQTRSYTYDGLGRAETETTPEAGQV